MSKYKTEGRMIKKDISNSKKFAALTPHAAVLFTMIIPHLNSHGKMNGGTGYIKDEVCPYVEYLTYENIPVLLKEINDKTNVKWFEYEGRYWIHSTKFLSDHQKLDLTKLGQDLLPSYSGPTPDLGVHEEEVEVEVKEVEVKGEVEGGFQKNEKPTPDQKSKSASGKPDNSKIPFKTIIDDLNKKTGKQYKHTPASTQRLIRARWNDGFTEQDFFKVHSNMAAKWLTDPKMQQYLRPETLYGTKFESYLNTQVSLSDQGKVSATTEKNISVGKQWLDKQGGKDAQPGTVR